MKVGNLDDKDGDTVGKRSYAWQGIFAKMSNQAKASFGESAQWDSNLRLPKGAWAKESALVTTIAGGADKPADNHGAPGGFAQP